MRRAICFDAAMLLPRLLSASRPIFSAFDGFRHATLPLFHSLSALMRVYGCRARFSRRCEHYYAIICAPPLSALLMPRFEAAASAMRRQAASAAIIRAQKRREPPCARAALARRLRAQAMAILRPPATRGCGQPQIAERELRVLPPPLDAAAARKKRSGAMLSARRLFAAALHAVFRRCAI